MMSSSVRAVDAAYYPTPRPPRKQEVRVEMQKPLVRSLREEISRCARDLLTPAERRACDMATD